MSDPYRSSGGDPCPRCRSPLARETDDWLVCGEGCGTWLGNGLVKTLLDPATLVKSKGNPFRATPLPPTKCVVCKQLMNDLYKGAIDVLTLGQCLEHGVWLETADREIFEAMYADEIRAHRGTTQEYVAKLATLAALDPDVAKLTLRVDALEKLVRDLQYQINDLRSRS